MKMQEPPPTHQKRTYTDWDKVVRTMKRKPGKWHLIGTFSVGIPNHLRKGIYKQFLDPDSKAPPERQMAQSWEVTARRTEDSVKNRRRVEVFMRYLGA
jgi:hypothetical protein